MNTENLDRTGGICGEKRGISGIGSGDVIGGGRKREVVPLILFFALAMLVRAPGLGRWCLAVDEFYFSRAVSFILEKGLPVFPGGGYYTRGIGLQYLTALPVSLMENLEFAVRIVPLLFGAMMIPLFFLFCRKFLGESESILCTVMLLLSSWHIEYSRFARMYMPFQFFFFLFLYHAHSGFRENRSGNRIAAWAVAALSVFVYEGSIVPVLLLGGLVLTGDAGKTNRSLAIFSVIFAALILLNLASNRVNFRTMGVPQSELMREAQAIPAPSSPPAPNGSVVKDSPVLLPDPGLLAVAIRPWTGRALLVLFACAGAYLTSRSIRRYEGPYPKSVLFLALVPLFLLPLLHQFGLLAVFGGILAMNRKDLREAVEKDLRYWGIYLVLMLLFWVLIAVKSGNPDRIRHFTVGYPPAKYSVVDPFLRAIPMWAVFLFGMAAISVLRNVLFRKWQEDAFPVTILVLCLALLPLFRTPYLETRYSFFYFPLFIVVAMGEIRAIRIYLEGRSLPCYSKATGVLLCTIPFMVFLSTEDFHRHHVMDVSAHAFNFRTGPYRQFADHWYPRADLKTPGRFVDGEYVEGDVVVLEQVAMSQYLKKPFLNYVGEESERFAGIARKRGTEEIWTGRPLISRPRQLASKVPENGHNSLWVIGVIKEFPGGTLNLTTRRQELAREFGLVIDLVFVGTDGRIGVWRVKRDIPSKVAGPGRHQHGSKERQIT